MSDAQPDPTVMKVFGDDAGAVLEDLDLAADVFYEALGDGVPYVFAGQPVDALRMGTERPTNGQVFVLVEDHRSAKMLRAAIRNEGITIAGREPKVIDVRRVALRRDASRTRAATLAYNHTLQVSFAPYDYSTTVPTGPVLAPIEITSDLGGIALALAHTDDHLAQPRNRNASMGHPAVRHEAVAQSTPAFRHARRMMDEVGRFGLIEQIRTLHPADKHFLAELVDRHHFGGAMDVIFPVMRRSETDAEFVAESQHLADDVVHAADFLATVDRARTPTWGERIRSMLAVPNETDVLRSEIRDELGDHDPAFDELVPSDRPFGYGRASRTPAENLAPVVSLDELRAQRNARQSFVR